MINKETIMKRILTASLITLLVGCTSPGVDRADTNTPINISYANVADFEKVTLKSDVGKNAAIGGLVGLAIGAVAGGDMAGAAIGAASGAALGATTTKISEGSSEAMSYTLQRPNGSQFKVVTDDDYLQAGDCVAVESGRTTNLRRVAPDLCGPPLAHPVEQDLAAHGQQQASDCDDAKQQLLKAETNADLDAATKKVKVLCH
jgi:outer membrane lipoprotein SlyB